MKYIRNYTDLQHFLNSIIPIIPYIELTLIPNNKSSLCKLLLFSKNVTNNKLSHFVRESIVMYYFTDSRVREYDATKCFGIHLLLYGYSDISEDL